jgi:outer membrane lipopolysaccharide assembly protein LptE/RlpB
MKKLLSTLAITVFMFTIGGCGFDLSSNDNTIELPNTYGINVEAVFTVPDFILNHQVTFEEISITYKVRKNDAFAAMVKIYVSNDQTADALENSDDDDVINVTLGVNENEKSGTVTSQLLIDILNSKQPQFVIGAQNLSVSPVSSVYIDLDVKYKGTYKL